ncbi:MAG: DUF3604 domain-containing protein, partial [Myxococcota bacterium]
MSGGCTKSERTEDPIDARAACRRQNPQRDVFFGDLHVHTALSFDAWVFDVRTMPADAFRFAQGQSIEHPLGGSSTVRLARPLDFAAVTDHAEYLGEVDLCTNPGTPEFDAMRCRAYREADPDAVVDFGIGLTSEQPQRFSEICGTNGQRCRTVARDVWARIQTAAEDAYDRTADCRFTSFIGYEWTAAIAGSNLHRNIIFRNARVPNAVSAYFEYPSVRLLHQILDLSCLNAGTGCDVIAIPHNTNWSNGNMFFVEYPGAQTVEDQRAQAILSGEVVPLDEFQQPIPPQDAMMFLTGQGSVSGAFSADGSVNPLRRPADVSAPFTDVSVSDFSSSASPRTSMGTAIGRVRTNVGLNPPYTYLAHSQADTDMASRIRSDLKEAGFQVWSLE